MTISDPQPATSGAILTLEDGQLEYWDSGSGPSFVFIHGVATSGDLWNTDLKDLAAHCRLIVYNRRGYGSSSAAPGNWPAHARDTAGLIQRLNAGPAIVAGYSGGANVALHLALDRPDLVTHLALLDPAWNLQRCLTPGLLRTLVIMKLLRWTGAYHEAAEKWLRYVSSDPAGGSAFERIPEARRQRLLGNIAGIFADLASGGGDVDERRLFDIVVPATIIDAALSPSFLRRSSHRLKQLLPAARRITLPQSGHWMSVDAPADLIQALRNVVQWTGQTGSAGNRD